MLKKKDKKKAEKNIQKWYYIFVLAYCSQVYPQPVRIDWLKNFIFLELKLFEIYILVQDCCYKSLILIDFQ